MSALPIDLELAAESLPEMLRGLGTTISITVVVLLLGLVLSVPMALARMSKRPWLSWPAACFVVFFRGAPLLTLLYLVYYGFGQIESLREGPLWFVFGSAFACAVIGLTLNHVAFMVDVVRGSLEAVPAGLVEAASALGITPRQTFREIQMPLAMRYGLAAYQNEVVMFTKGTAVISVITVVDLTAVANAVFEQTYDPFTPMLTAAFLYWTLVNVIRLGFGLLEGHLNRHLRAHDASRGEAGVRLPAAVAALGRRLRLAVTPSTPKEQTS
ncbi:ABC transporter permease [Oharaeibacter diazotrophicus]|uniref:Polar amino acid transport system permease protein/octopine/nopaline transport system permease protein/arginine/ornithine transport system permease protein n=1 Tax=Oharaeibacter diazotrophicus TaxID=1920512 RepID=A0A4R6RL46_9HYPH|nr:ABC transporter permease subunit [Oharaeibacter diazotrophicus]TDP87381.1 polar amino acid transport system permease protein/octopine/nopaline transport system permease protein/arginine/ornithine transport system permease protein [Oharaeibacter diazotrophicus]BBE70675.1 octopine transport system permease protein OccM [Pleomorphomonas sp. SM30]GLS77422.1 ABC transporter permease [Oharaeibacter diazotrophicus]